MTARLLTPTRPKALVAKLIDDRDNSYCFILENYSNQDFVVNNSDRIAQMILTPIAKMELEEANELPKTLRGEGGFGSTGK